MTINQLVQEFEKVCGPALIPMDRRVLNYLVECGGSAPHMAIPNKLFAGEIPEGHPNMVDLGLIEYRGDVAFITERGRAAIGA